MQLVYYTYKLIQRFALNTTLFM